MKTTSIEALLIQHEALKLKPYKDTVGKITIGIGRNLDDVGISEAEALYLLDNDIARCHAEAVKEFPWYLTLSTDRQNVIISMIFNIGMAGVLKFKGMISCLEARDYEGAADQMMASLWAKQVGARAVDLATMMRANG